MGIERIVKGLIVAGAFVAALASPSEAEAQRLSKTQLEKLRLRGEVVVTDGERVWKANGMCGDPEYMPGVDRLWNAKCVDVATTDKKPRNAPDDWAPPQNPNKYLGRNYCPGPSVTVCALLADDLEMPQSNEINIFISEGNICGNDQGEMERITGKLIPDYIGYGCISKHNAEGLGIRMYEQRELCIDNKNREEKEFEVNMGSVCANVEAINKDLFEKVKVITTPAPKDKCGTAEMIASEPAADEDTPTTGGIASIIPRGINLSRIGSYSCVDPDIAEGFATTIEGELCTDPRQVCVDKTSKIEPAAPEVPAAQAQPEPVKHYAVGATSFTAGDDAQVIELEAGVMFDLRRHVGNVHVGPVVGYRLIQAGNRLQFDLLGEPTQTAVGRNTQEDKSVTIDEVNDLPDDLSLVGRVAISLARDENSYFVLAIDIGGVVRSYDRAFGEVEESRLLDENGDPINGWVPLGDRPSTSNGRFGFNDLNFATRVNLTYLGTLVTADTMNAGVKMGLAGEVGTLGRGLESEAFWVTSGYFCERDGSTCVSLDLYAGFADHPNPERTNNTNDVPLAIGIRMNLLTSIYETDDTK